MSWFWMNMPLAVAFFAVWVGVPMWLILRHPDRGPVPAATDTSLQARQAAPVEPQVPVAAQPAPQLARVG